MVSEDHRCENRETPDNFFFQISISQTLPYPGLWIGESGLFPQVWWGDPSPFPFRPSGWGLCGVLLISSQHWGFLVIPLVGEEDLSFPLAGKTEILATPGHSVPRLTPLGSFPSPIPYSLLIPVLRRGHPIPRYPLPHDLPNYAPLPMINLISPAILWFSQFPPLRFSDGLSIW